MSDRPQFLSFVEGISSGVLILVMAIGFIAQYFVFRAHSAEFEVATKKKLENLDTEYKVLESRLDDSSNRGIGALHRYCKSQTAD